MAAADVLFPAPDDEDDDDDDDAAADQRRSVCMHACMPACLPAAVCCARDVVRTRASASLPRRSAAAARVWREVGVGVNVYVERVYS